MKEIKVRFCRWLIRILLPGYHLSRNPEKGLRRRSHGPITDANEGIAAADPGEGVSLSRYPTMES